MKENILLNKTFEFSIRIVNLYRYLRDEKREFDLARQILKSGTSIGANVTEATVAQSRKDFLAKIYIAYKEAKETEFWIKLLFATKILTEKQSTSLLNDLEEINKILSASLYTIRKKQKSEKNTTENK